MNKKILDIIVNMLAIIVIPVGLLIAMFIFLNQGKSHALLIYPSVFLWAVILLFIYTWKEKKNKKLQKEECLNSPSLKEFKQISFRKRNDPVVDVILENAKVYIKKSENSEKVVLKIEFLDNEITSEFPIDILNVK